MSTLRSSSLHPKPCADPACITLVIDPPVFHLVRAQRRRRVLEPDPKCETGHHVCISSRPYIEIGKVEQKCPSERHGPIQRVVNPYPERDQERGIVSKIIRVNEPNPACSTTLARLSVSGIAIQYFP